MTILSGQSIRKRNLITPFHERTKYLGMSFGVGPAGYDLRIAEEVDLPPGGFALASTVEEFRMDNDVLGIVHDKSTLARQGLSLFNTVIEPGWKGSLTLELANHSRKILRVRPGQPIAQVIFHLLDEPAERPYDGKYQDQAPGAQLPLFDAP